MDLRQSLLSAFAVKPVPFKFGGQEMHLKPLVTSDMLAARAWAKVNGAENSFRFLFVRSVCDADGNRVFTDEDTAIVDTLVGGLIDAAISRIYDISGMGSTEEKKA